MSEPTTNLPAVKAPGQQHSLAPRNFSEAAEAAVRYANSSLVPAHFKGKPDDCFIAIQLAARQNVDPLMLMQHSYVVGGKPGVEGKYAIALMNARGPFKTGVQYEYRGEGDARSCTAWGTYRATGKRCESTVNMAMVKAEGWIKNPKWTSMCDQMLAYRAGAFLARLYCPEVLMGMQTVEELEDIIDITPAPSQAAVQSDELEGHMRDMEEAFQRGEGAAWWQANAKAIIRNLTPEQHVRFAARKDELKEAHGTAGGDAPGTAGSPPPGAQDAPPASPAIKAPPGRRTALFNELRASMELAYSQGDPPTWVEENGPRIEQLNQGERDLLKALMERQATAG